MIYKTVSTTKISCFGVVCQRIPLEITPTCSNSLQISMVSDPAPKNLSVKSNWNIGSTISYNFKPEGFTSLLGEVPPFSALTKASCIIGLQRIGCCDWNRPRREKPHRNLKSSLFNSTMLYWYVVILCFWVFSTEASFPSELTGTASSASACKITGQDSSKHGRNFEETIGDCSPSRNRFHCKKGATRMRRQTQRY